MKLNYTFSETTLRVANNIYENKNISGILISKIPESDKQQLMLRYNVEVFFEGLYCFSKNIEPQCCDNCNTKTKLISLSKGFRKFCSISCSNKFNNKKSNSIRNINRAIKINEKNLPILEQCANQYCSTDNIKTIKELAKEFNISYTTLQKYLSFNNIKPINNLTKILQKNKISKEYPELFNKDYFLEQQSKKKTAKNVSDELGVSTNTVCVYSRKIGVPFPNNSSSSAEYEICNFFNNYNIVRNSRQIISPYEIDIFVPEYNLGIEHNGVYWHSEENGKDKFYHLNKQILAEENNIKLIQIFDYEWKNRQHQIKGYFDTLLQKNIRIFARNTILKCPSKKETKEFLDTNHIHGNVGYNLSYGLYYNDELVSLLSLGKPRFSKKYDYEVLRFCNKIGVSVVGGLSKLVSYIKKTLEFNSIVSYTHRRLFDGNSFIKSGFLLTHKTDPGYFWANKYNGEYLMRYKTQKHKLNTTLTEAEYMKSKNFYKIWDCGQLVFCLYK